MLQKTVIGVLILMFHKANFANVENLKFQTLSTDEIKYCRYRRDPYLNEVYPSEFFNEISGYGCYLYGDHSRFKNNTRYKTYITEITYHFNNVTYAIPYSEDVNGKQFYYNYKNNNTYNLLSENFRSEKYFKKWLECAKNAENCCLNQMTNENIYSNGKCPVIWDAWDCFPEADPNSAIQRNCPSYIFMSDPPCVQKSSKTCFNNATWNQTTDYTTCSYLSNIRNRHIFHIYSLFVCIAVCAPAIFIFLFYEQLRITRVILHRNLLITITIKNILMIMSKMMIILDAIDERDTVLARNGVPCRMLTFFEKVAGNAMYAAMLVDGFYLHKIIVTVFRKDPPMSLFYFIFTILSLIPPLIWAGFKALQSNIYCWVVDDSWRHWIIDGSRYAILGINIFLLADIIRVLIWKLKRNNSGTQHARTTLRATLILFPLFGIQFITVSQTPENASCFWDDIFYYISYTMDSTQGILVSLFYCYFNKEVQILLKKTYSRLKYEILLKFDGENHHSEEERRDTGATYVPENLHPMNNTSEIKNNTALNTEEEYEPNSKAQIWLKDIMVFGADECVNL